MLSRQEEDRLRRQVLRNDLSVRQQQEESRRVFAPDQSIPRQATTMQAFALAEAATPRGRFSAVETATVVGAQPTVNYPAAAAHQHDPCGPEPSLGYRIDAMEPSTDFSSASPVEQTGGPTDPATPLAVERGGSPLSQSDDPTTEVNPQRHFTPRGRVGSSPVPYRRF